MRGGLCVGLVLAGACGRLEFASLVAPADSTVDVDTDADTDDSMVAIPAGPFMMGCNMALDTSCLSVEFPIHEITLSAYLIDRTEVTQSAYAACVTAGSCTAPSAGFDPVAKGDHPVTFVSRAQAAVYCAWAGKRLPTEAEWEKAARGTDARTYPWGEAEPTCELVNSFVCVEEETHPVGSHPAGASPYGLLDMAGNVWEWTADYYDPDYYSDSPAVDPTGPVDAPGFTVRGGYFGNSNENIRTAVRAQNALDETFEWLGFRCAR